MSKLSNIDEVVANIYNAALATTNKEPATMDSAELDWDEVEVQERIKDLLNLSIRAQLFEPGDRDKHAMKNTLEEFSHTIGGDAFENTAVNNFDELKFKDSFYGEYAKNIVVLVQHTAQQALAGRAVENTASKWTDIVTPKAAPAINENPDISDVAEKIFLQSLEQVQKEVGQVPVYEVGHEFRLREAIIKRLEILQIGKNFKILSHALPDNQTEMKAAINEIKLYSIPKKPEVPDEAYPLLEKAVLAEIEKTLAQISLRSEHNRLSVVSLN